MGHFIVFFVVVVAAFFFFLSLDLTIMNKHKKIRSYTQSYSQTDT